MVELAVKALELLCSVVRCLTSPISVEVSYFQFEDFSSHASDVLAVITPYPKRYHVKLGLTNRSDRVIYIVSYSARVGDTHTFSQTRFDNALRLEAHQPKEHSIILPLDAASKPVRTGRFSIRVWPSFGRSTKVNGVFPIK